MRTIPSLPGAYALLLRLDKPVRLSAGKLGEANYLPGQYVYSGSAFGPGGLRARLGRHLTGPARLHWHIDYLRTAAPVSEFCFTTLATTVNLECIWSQALVRQPEAWIPQLGFGASDCASGCLAHLVAFPPEQPTILQHLAATPGIIFEKFAS
jgi:Uri superfamily endonuclease